jgi:hypothetical protein
MRTTVNLDEDVFRVAKTLARQRGQSLGRVLCDCFRAAVGPVGPDTFAERNGIPLVPRRAGARPVTPGLVRKLLEADQ